MSGCTTDLYPEVDTRLTTIATKPHTNEVELFFVGEVPKEEYIKVAALEAHQGAYVTLIRKLQTQARAHGADALLVQAKNVMPDVYTDIITERITTTPYSSLAGIAIKYKKNLDTALLPKQQEVELYDAMSGAFQPVLALRFSVGGDIVAKEEKHPRAAMLYNTYIQPYTLRTLQESGPSWTHRQQEGFVVERQQHIGGMLQKQMQFDYDPARRITEIRIKEQGGATQIISYTYNEAGQLTQRDIFRSGKPYIQEVYTYDAKGQASQVLLYNTNLPEKLPLLRSRFSYYTLGEI